MKKSGRNRYFRRSSTAKTTYMLKAIILSSFVVSSLAAIAQTNPSKAKPDATQTAYKFLDDISIEPAAEPAAKSITAIPDVKKQLLAVAHSAEGSIESAEALHFKYSLLLDVEVELVKNTSLFRTIDQWYGVKYLFGGSTKAGIDCSALMQVFFTSMYGIALPRTAKMQYDFSRKISRTELKEGDLLFFNTRGGVSHVGMYLANNKFVHASVKGVTISDMFEPYYASRLIGTGRVLEEVNTTATASISSKL